MKSKPVTKYRIYEQSQGVLLGTIDERGTLHTNNSVLRRNFSKCILSVNNIPYLAFLVTLFRMSHSYYYSVERV